MAKTEWHAKDKAYSKHFDIQPDRLKYSVVTPLFNLYAGAKS
jgi:hypothetical protein